MKQMQIQLDRVETTRGFLKCAIWIGLPVVLQNMVSSLINLLDVFMLGQLGEVAITASSVSNQWYLLFMVLANGVASASGMFISQFWGCRDTRRIHSYMGIMFFFSLLLAFVFGGISLMNPRMVIRLYSMDENVILDGGRYLRIISITFWLYAVNLTCGTSLRSIGQTNIPMIASVLSLCCNLLGNYVLIFGKFGVPQLGITGAAYATVLARMMEAVILLCYIAVKKPPVYASLRELMGISKDHIRIMLFIMAATIPLRTIVYMDICGILRSGGDNTYCFLANLFGVWCVGLPLVFLTAVILKLPIYVVYFMAVMEEAGKLLICGSRVKKDKWLRNLT